MVQKTNSNNLEVIEQEISVYKSFLYCIASSFLIKMIPYKNISSKRFFNLAINIFLAAFLIGMLELCNFIDKRPKSSHFTVRIYFTLVVLIQQIFFNAAVTWYHTIFSCKDKSKLVTILMLSNIYFPIFRVLFTFINFHYDLTMALTNAFSTIFLTLNVISNEKKEIQKDVFLIVLFLSFIQSMYMFILLNLIALCY